MARPQARARKQRRGRGRCGRRRRRRTRRSGNSTKIEVSELDAGSFFEIAGQQAERESTRGWSTGSRSRMPGITSLTVPGRYLLAEELMMRVAHPLEEVIVQIVAGVLERVMKDNAVGPAGDRAMWRSWTGRAGFAGAVHGADAGAAGSTSVQSIWKKTRLGMGTIGGRTLAIWSVTLDNTSYEAVISYLYDLADASRRPRDRPGAENQGAAITRSSISCRPRTAKRCRRR